MWLFTAKDKPEVTLVLTKPDDIENASEYQNVSTISNPRLQKGKRLDAMASFQCLSVHRHTAATHKTQQTAAET
jgi:hypothetical protein